MISDQLGVAKVCGILLVRYCAANMAKCLPDVPVVLSWTTDDVVDWLLQVNLGDCSAAFRRRNIDGAKLLTLTEANFVLWAGDIKIRQRMQITRYLNECRNRENQGIALKLKRKSGPVPPPVPQPDYTGSIGDDDSYDEGWDTDFDDDDMEEEETSGSESGGRKSPSEEVTSHSLLAPQCVLLTENGGDPRAAAGVGTQKVAKILRSFAFESPVAVDGQMAAADQGACVRKGSRAASGKSTAMEEEEDPVPKRKTPLPRPPDLPVVVLRNGRPNTVNGAARHSAVRPQHQPPPVPVKPGLHDDDRRGPAYEVPTPSPSDASVTELRGASSLNSLSISGGSSSNSHHDSASQLELCQELVMQEDYDLPDESQWSGSSGVSSSSDRPALPPKQQSLPECVPPPLPEKPQRRVAAPPAPSASLVLPLRDNRPPLPCRKTSDENSAKARNRPSLDGCKQAITSLTSMLSNLSNRLTSDKRSDSTNGVDKVATPDKDVVPTITAAASEITKSYSMSSLRQGTADNASNRPLPPVPNSTKGNARQSHVELPPTRNSSTALLESWPWFHKVERDAAASILKQMGQSGAYLVRESRRAGESNPYSLTVFYDNKVSHLNIRQRADATFALGKEKDNEKTFLSVEELIVFHQREPILLTAKGQQIGKTCLVVHP